MTPSGTVYFCGGETMVKSLVVVGTGEEAVLGVGVLSVLVFSVDSSLVV
jgi:hypothetical protein